MIGDAGWVGIFWLLQDYDRQIAIPVRGCPLSEAEEYGDCLTFADGHYDTWEAWRSGTLPLAASMRRIMARSEYEEWPRGRIVYERPSALFVIYADRQAFPHRALIETTFHLPSGRTAMRTDLHYRSMRHITAVRGAPP